MSFFGKVFKYQSSENFDAFVNSLGLSSQALDFFTNFKPDQKIEKSDNNYIYTLVTARGDKRIPFTSGVAVEDQGRDFSIKNTFTVDENDITHVMKFDSGLSITSKKKFSPTKMVEEVTNSNWDGKAYVTYHAED